MDRENMEREYLESVLSGSYHIETESMERVWREWREWREYGERKSTERAIT